MAAVTARRRLDTVMVLRPGRGRTLLVTAASPPTGEPLRSQVSWASGRDPLLKISNNFTMIIRETVNQMINVYLMHWTMAVPPSLAASLGPEVRTGGWGGASTVRVA